MKTQSWLGGLLALQLLLAAALSLNSLRERSADVSTPFLDFAVSDVDRIVIDDNASNSTTLARSGADWGLASLADLPANKAKADALLETLGGLQTTMPVVSTDAGRERFDVSAEKFQRRLRLYDGEELLGEYFFGTSPGFRRTHGRRSGDDEVYALAFNNFDLPGDGNDWLDKTLLGAGTLQRIKGVDYELSKEGDAWQMAATEADAPPTLATAKVDELVNALESLRVLRAEGGLPEGERVVVEVTNGDGALQYEFATADSKYYVKRSDLEQAFTISQTDYERITGKTRAILLEMPEPAEGASEDAPA